MDLVGDIWLILHIVSIFSSPPETEGEVMLFFIIRYGGTESSPKTQVPNFSDKKRKTWLKKESDPLPSSCQNKAAVSFLKMWLKLHFSKHRNFWGNFSWTNEAKVDAFGPAAQCQVWQMLHLTYQCELIQCITMPTFFTCCFKVSFTTDWKLPQFLILQPLTVCPAGGKFHVLKGCARSVPTDKHEAQTAKSFPGASVMCGGSVSKLFVGFVASAHTFTDTEYLGCPGGTDWFHSSLSPFSCLALIEFPACAPQSNQTVEFVLAGGATEVGIIMILIRRGVWGETSFVLLPGMNTEGGSIAIPFFSCFKEEERGMR